MFDGLSSLQLVLISQAKSNQDLIQKQSQKEKCELVFDKTIPEEELDRISLLIDDEELEMRDLQAGSDILVCSDHLATSGILRCSLCKGC